MKAVLALVSSLLALQPVVAFHFDQPLCQTKLATTKCNVKTTYTTKTYVL